MGALGTRARKASPFPKSRLMCYGSENAVNGRYSLYADDTILYCNGVDVPRVISSLQQCFNCASRWYTAKRLVLNTAKCSVMLFGASIDDKEQSNCKLYIANTGIEYSKITKYLGVYYNVDESLKFEIHVNNLTAKLDKLIGWLGRLRKTLPTSLLHVVYNSYVLPNFDNACTVWGSANANTKCIQRRQNRAARIICKKFDIINYRGIDLVC